MEHGGRILDLPFSLEVLLDLRRRYRAARESFAAGRAFRLDDPLSELIGVYRATWDVLGKLESQHPLYLPPIYLSDELKQLVKDILLNIGAREPCESWTPERFDAALEPIQMGSFALGGAKRVGKTTLMRAIALAVAITSPNYFFAFINLASRGPFQRGERGVGDVFQTVRSQMRLLVEILQSDPTELGVFPLFSFESITPRVEDRRLSNGSLIKGRGGLPPLGIGIMLDEVQYLEEIDRDVAADFLSKLGRYARGHCAAMVIVAGGSFRIREILGMGRGLSTIVRWHSQLADFRYVSAARTPDQLKDYLEARYPHRRDVSILTEGDRKVLLHATGGIGRYINQLFCILPDLQEARPGNSSGELAAAIVTSGYSRNLPVEPFLPSPTPIAPFVIALLRQHALDRNRVDEIVRDIKENRNVVIVPSDVEAPLKLIVEGVQSLLPADSLPSKVAPFVAAREVVLRLVDAEVLYIRNYDTMDATVQLAVPSDATRHFANAPSREDVDQLLAFASSQLLEPARVNAGLCVERFAFPRLHHITEWRDWTRESDVVTDRNLSVSGGNLYISNEDRTKRLATKEEVDGKTWRWGNGIGLDAVYIEFASGEIQVRGWQGTTDPEGTSYALERLATYRRHLRFNKKEVDVFLRRKNKTTRAETTATSSLAGSAPYSSFPALLVRAEQGFLTLCSALQSMFPRYTVRVMSLLVTTTKEIPEQWSKHFSSVSMDDRHVQAMGMRGAQKYEVRVRSGFGWILEELVESEALKLPLQSAIYVIENGVGAFGPSAAAKSTRRRQPEWAGLTALGGGVRETSRTKWAPGMWNEEWTSPARATPSDTSPVRNAKRGRPEQHEEEEEEEEMGRTRRSTMSMRATKRHRVGRRNS